MTFRGFEVRRVDYITRPISPPKGADLFGSGS